MVELGCDLPPLRNRVIQEGNEMRSVDWVAYLLLAKFLYTICSFMLGGKERTLLNGQAKYSTMADIL